MLKQIDKKSPGKSKKILIMFLFILVLLAGGAYIYMLKNSSTDTNSDIDGVITQVSNHIILPNDEKPVLITVADRSKIKAKFLEVSKTNDKVLIYEKHQIAVIYRPSIDRVIDITKITIGDPNLEAPKAAWPSNLP